MSMYKSQLPSGQPRSLRSIAESKAQSGGFPPILPAPDAPWRTEYKDSAADIGAPKAAGMTPADHKPFKLRGA